MATGVPSRTKTSGLARLRESIPPLDPAGRAYVAGAAAATMLGWRFRSFRAPGLAATAAFAVLFREPPRVPPTGAAPVAPADGVIELNDLADAPAELDLPDQLLPRIQIAVPRLGPYLLRSPIAGTVAVCELAPADPPTSQRELWWLRIDPDEGHPIGLAITAGRWGTRISPHVAQGDHVGLGDPVGLLAFGGIVELFLPSGSLPAIKPGQHTVSGETRLTWG